MARRRLSGMIRVPNIMEIGLTLLAVQKAPDILNKFLFSGNPLTGMTANLVSAAGVAALGHFFLKKPLVVDTAIAAGAVEILDPVINQLLGSVGMPVTQTKYITGKADEVGNFVLAESNYSTLNDYTNNVDPMAKWQYQTGY